jgi:hypothetical protein
LKRWLFKFIAAGGATVAALGLTEFVLRIFEARTTAPQQITSGFLRYDESLGWRLSTNWQGRHHYAGFDVAYAVDDAGFRRPPPAAPTANGLRRTLVFGDSFTFGIGVDDHETFVARLNEAKPAGVSGPSSELGLAEGITEYVNCGVPGFSTDQELLLAEAELARRPDVAGVLLVICLANDLFDNPRSYSLQAHMAKPFFQHEAAGLVLTNVPVPRAPKLPGNPSDDLARAIMGPGWQPDWATRLSRWSAIVRLIHRELFGLRHPRVQFPGHQRDELALFWSLVDRLSGACQARRIRFGLALMPGSSAVLYPNSLPGQYQRHLRDQILSEATSRRLSAIDLVDALNQTTGTGGPLFLNDGHLSARSHVAVAHRIREAWAVPNGVPPSGGKAHE